jgi:acyl-coenzyme A thioesterase PaaI-like protein
VVQELAPGRAVVTLRDRRRVRNHLDSVHAIALANLAEVASGLAMLTAAGDDTRGIVLSLTIRYHHKARGRLTAVGSAAPPSVAKPLEAVAHADIHDAAGELVADADVTWRLSPREEH